ncbi:MAG: DUF58 domain-containing protein [bacterium]|nr:DUF58 domain-containing protein [bacterium]
MIPSLRLVWLVALGLPLLLLGLVSPLGMRVALAYDAVLVLLLIVDRSLTPDPRLLQIRRGEAPRWVQGRPAVVELQLQWQANRASDVILKDQPPVGFSTETDRHRVRVRPGENATLRYPVVPAERGRQAFGVLALRVVGPLGLQQRQRVVDLTAEIRVYPDLVTLTAREAALAVPSAWNVGIRRSPIPGEGREFHQLRDYVRGDDVRMMDWKALAHRGRPTVREYRVERNQRVILLIDSGRLMTSRVADRLRFDWAVQAAGRLARVVLAQGDAVGLAFFGRELKNHLPAGKGPGHLGRVADMLSEAAPTLEEPDLGRALGLLMSRTPRRTLVVVFTEIADPRTAEAAVRHVGRLAPRHLGLVVSLADADLDAERFLELRDAEAVYRRVAADELWQDSRRTIRSLEARGAMVVRARADALAGESVERYMEVKRRGRL